MNFLLSTVGRGSGPEDVHLLLCDTPFASPLRIRSMTLSSSQTDCTFLLKTSIAPTVEVEDVVVKGTSKYGIDLFYTATFVTKNVRFRKLVKSAVVLNSVTWESHGSLVFENFELAGSTVIDATAVTWSQLGTVHFVNNSASDNESSLVFLYDSVWNSTVPVRFSNNSLPNSSRFIQLQDGAKLISTYSMLIEGAGQDSSTLFTCTSGSTLWIPQSCDACDNYCTTADTNSVPILSWEKSNYFLFHRRNTNYRAGLDSIAIPSQVTIPAGSQTGELTLQLVSSSPANGLPVTLTIQPFVPQESDQFPEYFLSGDASQVTVITSSSSLSLPTLNILFPFPQPDVICFPPSSSSSNGTEDNGEEVERSVLTKLKRLVEVKKKQDGSLVEEKAQDLTELAWTQEQPSAGEVLFVANVSSLQPQGGGGALVEVLFQSAEKGSTMELEDGESIGFEEDSLKWSLLIRNWPWSDPSNLLLSTTMAEPDQPQNAPQSDEEGEGEGGGQKGKEQEVWRLEGVFSSALLRVLLRSWVDGQLDTPQAVAVEVWLSEEDEAEVEARFMFAHFEEEMRYDPDISVLLNGEGSKGDGEEEEGGEEDGLWWKWWWWRWWPWLLQWRCSWWPCGNEEKQRG
ncbi:hypothetical protein QOT17_007210 [Balamuthia mandrillaris]